MSIFWKLISTFFIILVTCIGIGCIVDFIRETIYLTKHGYNKFTVIFMFIVLFIVLMLACILVIYYFTVSMSIL